MIVKSKACITCYCHLFFKKTLQGHYLGGQGKSMGMLASYTIALIWSWICVWIQSCLWLSRRAWRHQPDSLPQTSLPHQRKLCINSQNTKLPMNGLARSEWFLFYSARRRFCLTTGTQLKLHTVHTVLRALCEGDS